MFCSSKVFVENPTMADLWRLNDDCMLILIWERKNQNTQIIFAWRNSSGMININLHLWNYFNLEVFLTVQFSGSCP